MTALKRDPLAAGAGSVLLRSGHGGGGGSGESIGRLQPALAAQALEMPAARTPCRHSGGSHFGAAPTASATASSPRAIGGPARLAHSRRGSGACPFSCHGARVPIAARLRQARQGKAGASGERSLPYSSSRCREAAARASRRNRPSPGPFRLTLGAGGTPQAGNRCQADGSCDSGAETALHRQKTHVATLRPSFAPESQEMAALPSRGGPLLGSRGLTGEKFRARVPRRDPRGLFDPGGGWRVPDSSLSSREFVKASCAC